MKSRFIYLFAFLFLLSLLFWFVLGIVKDNGPGVVFMDVGQGDATLIRTPNGLNILVDGGPDKIVLERLAEFLPFWDKTIDLMILTHPHDDHLIGLTSVLSSYIVKKVAYTAVAFESEIYSDWLQQIKQKNIPTVIIDRPQEIMFDDQCRLKILYPIKSLAGARKDNLNDSSIVSMYDCQNKKMLLTGDIEHEAELELIQSGQDLKADILKISHHGSDSSSQDEFIDKVDPRKAIISVGENNKFNHPSKRTLMKLQRSESEILRTDLLGSINMKLSSWQ